jgi:hypothetical protein
MTLPGIGYTTVITPAPFNTNAAAITRNVEPTGSGVSAIVKSSGSVVTGTSTGMGIAVSPTASKSGTGIEGGSLHLAWGIMAVAVWIL